MYHIYTKIVLRKKLVISQYKQDVIIHHGRHLQKFDLTFFLKILFFNGLKLINQSIEQSINQSINQYDYVFRLMRAYKVNNSH